MKKTDKILLINAFAIYPDNSSSEGIVNRNWIETIKDDYEIYLISSHKSIQIKPLKKGCDYIQKEDYLLKWLYKKARNNRKTIDGLIYRGINKISLLFTSSRESLFLRIWKRKQKSALKQAFCGDKDILVWVRILPVFPLEIILAVWDKRKFPLIININDPVSGLEGNRDDLIMIKTQRIVQCWTFPSHRLAMETAEKFSLEKSRCLVLPHAMQNRRKLYTRKITASEKIKILYTGTFYKSSFSTNLGEVLKDVAYFQELDFIFILSQYDLKSLKWLEEHVPNATILLNLERNKVLEILNTADCVLVTDSKDHYNLLKGKLAEAISFGVPIWSVTYPGSVLDIVVKAYGGFSSNHESPVTITKAIQDIIHSLNNKEWLSYFYKNRDTVIKNFCEEQIRELTKTISEYAHNRFQWQTGKVGNEPPKPNIPKWP